MSSLHLRISQARKSRKISQANLAERLGVTRTACSHWETGRAKPSTKHLEKMAETLAVDAHWLITGKKRGAPTAAEKAEFEPGKPSDSVAFESPSQYGALFDKETLKVSGAYFALNRSNRKLIRDLLAALAASSKDG